MGYLGTKWELNVKYSIRTPPDVDFTGTSSVYVALVTNDSKWH